MEFFLLRLCPENRTAGARKEFLNHTFSSQYISLYIPNVPTSKPWASFEKWALSWPGFARRPEQVQSMFPSHQEDLILVEKLTLT